MQKRTASQDDSQNEQPGTKDMLELYTKPTRPVLKFYHHQECLLITYRKTRFKRQYQRNFHC